MKINAFKIFRNAIAEQGKEDVLSFVNEYCRYSEQETVSDINITKYNKKDYELLQGLFKAVHIWAYTPVWATYIAYISEELDIDWSNDLIPYDGYLYDMFETFIEDKYDSINLPTEKDKMLDDWYEYQEDNKNEYL